MKIFLAGATGVMGRKLVPALVEAGHDVVGTTRSAAKAQQLEATGAEPTVLDALDRDAVVEAVEAAKPEVVIHQLTAIGETNFKNLDQSYVETNKLRTKGVDYLLEAARTAGATRFIAQSFTGWPNEHAGTTLKTEEDPLDTEPVRTTAKSLAALKHIESAVPGAPDIDGVVLRYGLLYGPGTAWGVGGESLDLIGGRKFPIVGRGTGVFSFVHLDDAVGATVTAVETGPPGLYNIVDDEPAPVSEWLPYLAEAIGAKKPRRVPAWLVRPMLGEFGVATMTTMRGSSNAKAKRELDWTLRYPSWRQGFRTGLQL